MILVWPGGRSVAAQFRSEFTCLGKPFERLAVTFDPPKMPSGGVSGRRHAEILPKLTRTNSVDGAACEFLRLRRLNTRSKSPSWSATAFLKGIRGSVNGGYGPRTGRPGPGSTRSRARVSARLPSRRTCIRHEAPTLAPHRRGSTLKPAEATSDRPHRLFPVRRVQAAAEPSFRQLLRHPKRGRFQLGGATHCIDNFARQPVPSDSKTCPSSAAIVRVIPRNVQSSNRKFFEVFDYPVPRDSTLNGDRPLFPTAKHRISLGKASHASQFVGRAVFGMPRRKFPPILRTCGPLRTRRKKCWPTRKRGTATL